MARLALVDMRRNNPCMLFTPITLNQTRIENRIVLPAMVTRLSGEDGHINEDITARYLRFARGEVGLIIIEAMAVHASKSGPLLRMNADEFIPEHTELARRIHNTSPSKVFPQIIHFLKIARSGWRQTVDMLSLEEIDGIVEAYGQAAARARTCGYDGVELHMAHAYTTPTRCRASCRAAIRAGMATAVAWRTGCGCR